MVLLTSQKVAQNIIYHSEPSVGKFVQIFHINALNSMCKRRD